MPRQESYFACGSPVSPHELSVGGVIGKNTANRGSTSSLTKRWISTLDGARAYRYRGTYTIGGLFEETICPQTLASPTGDGVKHLAEELPI
jgi:hypothetical protein